MEPESSKEAAKQPMEAEAGDPEDPRDLGNLIYPRRCSAVNAQSNLQNLVGFVLPQKNQAPAIWASSSLC
jgi:hypothetical protein